MANLPKHHPDEALLLDYADGSLAGPFSLAIATHLTLCPACRRAVTDMEVIGGGALAELDGPSVEDGVLTQTLTRLDGPVSARLAADNRMQDKSGFGAPRPLRDLLNTPLEQLPFKRLAGGEVYLLDVPQPFRGYVLRVAGGKAVPKHGHSGMEMTVVLRGGFTDAGAHYDRGDVGFSDEARHHAPRADPEGCTCLVVSAGPLRAGDPITALVARWFGI